MRTRVERDRNPTRQRRDCRVRGEVEIRQHDRDLEVGRMITQPGVEPVEAGTLLLQPRAARVRGAR